MAGNNFVCVVDNQQKTKEIKTKKGENKMRKDFVPFSPQEVKQYEWLLEDHDIMSQIKRVFYGCLKLFLLVALFFLIMDKVWLSKDSWQTIVYQDLRIALIIAVICFVFGLAIIGILSMITRK